MKSKVVLTLVATAVSHTLISRLGAQGLVHPPDHNLFPPGSVSNPIYVQPVNPPPVIQPPVIQPLPQINTPPRDRQDPRQERLAPRAEFEAIKFIPTEPYAYRLSKGDLPFPSTLKAQLPRGKSRIVIGKSKHLATADKSAYMADTSEIWALANKYHADEIIVHGGRRWSDGEEVLVKFVVWK